MILVLLGTQDKSFKRLLKTVENEIINKNIKEEVIVQAGYTKYTSQHMKIFDLISQEKLDDLMKKSRIIITHGGVGSILSSLKYQKPIIAAARLSKYAEHTNDHQIQIIEEFEKNNYILALKDFTQLGKLIKKCDTFTPKKYKSNNQKFIKMLDNYIKKTNHKSWWNRYKYFIIILLIAIFFLIT